MNTPLVCAALAAAVTFPAAAQDWLDNFNDGSAIDGSPVMWVDSPAFGSAFEVVDGDLLVSMQGGTNPISSPRVNSYFPNGACVRARMVAHNGPGRFTVAFADQPTGIQGYVASLTTCGSGRVELFRGDVLGSIVHLGNSPVSVDYTPLEEFIVQLDVFDGVVSARVWSPGEPFPEPQVIANDTHYADGVPSIAIQDFGEGGPCGRPGDFTDADAIVRYMQVSSTPLTHSGAGDFNADGVNDFFDIEGFLAAFSAQDAAADWNGDGLFDFFDVGFFLADYQSGQP